MQKGVTEFDLFRNDWGWIRLDDVFGTIEPENYYQNEITGESNINAARGAIFDLYLTILTDTEEFE